MDVVALALEDEFSEKIKKMVRKKTDNKVITLEDSIMYILNEFYDLQQDPEEMVDREFKEVEEMLERAESNIQGFLSEREEEPRGNEEIRKVIREELKGLENLLSERKNLLKK